MTKNYQPPVHSPRAFLFLFLLCFALPALCCGGCALLFSFSSYRTTPQQTPPSAAQPDTQR